MPGDILVVAEWDQATGSMHDGIKRIYDCGAPIKVLDKVHLDPDHIARTRLPPLWRKMKGSGYARADFSASAPLPTLGLIGYLARKIEFRCLIPERYPARPRLPGK